MGVTRDGLRASIVDPSDLSDACLVDSLEELQRMQSMLDERKLTAAATLVDRIEHTYRECGAWSSTALDVAESELSMALTINRYSSGRLIGIAMALRDRLPRVRRALADGLIDLYRAHQVNDATCNVPEDLIGEVERRALEKIVPDPSSPRSGLTGKRLTNAVARVVNKIDPDGVRERRVRRAEERYIGVRKSEDGMASLHGYLAAEDAQRIDGRLREMAANPCRADGRTFDQRRADSLVALADGHGFLPCCCAGDACPRRTGAPALPRKPLVHVVMLAETLDGTADEPGFLDGYGLIDADHARRIAAGATVVPLRVPEVVDSRESPAQAQHPAGPLPASAFRYRPGAILADWVRAMGGMCRWPHCDAAAWNSDLDHTEPFNHGSPHAGGTTTADDLKPYCRHHHRLKHSGYWRERTEADGSITVLSPTGNAYNSVDAGLLDVLGIEVNRVRDQHRKADRPDAGTPATAVPAEGTPAGTRPRPRKHRTRDQNSRARIRAERRRRHATVADGCRMEAEAKEHRLRLLTGEPVGAGSDEAPPPEESPPF